MPLHLYLDSPLHLLRDLFLRLGYMQSKNILVCEEENVFAAYRAIGSPYSRAHVRRRRVRVRSRDDIADESQLLGAVRDCVVKEPAHIIAGVVP